MRIYVNAKFPLGKLVATVNALEQLDFEDIARGLVRHASGDWGNLEADDLAANDLAVTDGSRILSAYGSEAGITYWIITE